MIQCDFNALILEELDYELQEDDVGLRLTAIDEHHQDSANVCGLYCYLTILHCSHTQEKVSFLISNLAQLKVLLNTNTLVIL